MRKGAVLPFSGSRLLLSPIPKLMHVARLGYGGALRPSTAFGRPVFVGSCGSRGTRRRSIGHCSLTCRATVCSSLILQC